MNLFFLKVKITTQDPLTEAWQNAGEKFLRQTKTKIFVCHQFQKGEQQQKTFLQSSNKKGGAFKQAPIAQTTHQPVQEYPQ